MARREEDLVDVTGRMVRGGERHFKTLEEKEEERRLQERRAGLVEKTPEEIESEYLTPGTGSFVETDCVKRFEDRIRLWVSLGYPVHLIGPTACGKTTIAMHVARTLGRPVVWLNGDEEMTTSNLIGGYTQFEQESYRDRFVHNVFKSKDTFKADWVDNPLTLACKYGYTLVYNEFSRCKPATNNILLSVFEERVLELPTKFGEDRYVEVHPDFNAVLTSNTIEYAGIHRAQDALLDRMIGIYMDYYDAPTEVEIVMAHTGIQRADAEKIVRIVRGIRQKVDPSECPGTRACIMIGQGLAALGDGGALEQVCLDVLATKVQDAKALERKREVVKSVIGALSGKAPQQPIPQKPEQPAPKKPGGILSKLRPSS